MRVVGSAAIDVLTHIQYGKSESPRTRPTRRRSRVDTYIPNDHGPRRKTCQRWRSHGGRHACKPEVSAEYTPNNVNANSDDVHGDQRPRWNAHQRGRMPRWTVYLDVTCQDGVEINEGGRRCIRHSPTHTVSSGRTPERVEAISSDTSRDQRPLRTTHHRV